MSRIRVTVQSLAFEAELEDSAAASALRSALPLKASLSRWGEEYYGDIGVLDVGNDSTARDVMELGELAYWKPGRALCIFFGPTPASHGDEPRAASPVVPLGRLVDADLAALSALGPTVEVSVEAIPQS